MRAHWHPLFKSDGSGIPKPGGVICSRCHRPIDGGLWRLWCCPALHWLMWLHLECPRG